MIITEPFLTKLKSFLNQKLQPICDADPDVLSEYVLALLKHDIPYDALKEKCIIQLNDFLREHSESFVDDLFVFLLENHNRSQHISQSNDKTKKPLISEKTMQQQESEEDDHDIEDEDEEYRGHKRSRKDIGYSGENEHLSNESNREKIQKICRNFQKFGSCKRGDSCNFLHQQSQYPKDFDSHSRWRFAKNILSDDPTARKLIVDKLPLEFCTKERVFGYFKRFGRILHVESDSSSKRASIAFSKHEDAVKAYQCPESMFGNRFVKIFWDLDQSIAPEVEAKERDRISSHQSNPKHQNLHSREIAQQREKLLLMQIEQHKLLMEKLKSKDIDENNRTELLMSLDKISTLIKDSSNSAIPSSTDKPLPLKKSFSLDLRSKTLKLSKLPDNKTKEEILQTFQVSEELSGNGPSDFEISFGERYQAEAALNYIIITYQSIDPQLKVTWK